MIPEKITNQYGEEVSFSNQELLLELSTLIEDNSELSCITVSEVSKLRDLIMEDI